MAKHHDLVEIEGILVRETSEGFENEGAYLINTGTKKEWLPKKAVEKTAHPNGKPNWYIFDVPEDLATDKGLV